MLCPTETFLRFPNRHKTHREGNGVPLFFDGTGRDRESQLAIKFRAYPTLQFFAPQLFKQRPHRFQFLFWDTALKIGPCKDGERRVSFAITTIGIRTML